MSTFDDIDPTLSTTISTGAKPSKSSMQTQLAVIKSAGQAIEAGIGDHETRLAAVEAGGISGVVDIGQDGEWVTPDFSGGVMVLGASHIHQDVVDIEVEGEPATRARTRFVRFIDDSSPSAPFTATIPNDGVPGKTVYVGKVPSAQTGAVTLQVDGYGSDNDRTVDGGDSVPLPVDVMVGVVCETNSTGTKAKYVTTLNPADFLGRVIFRSAVDEVGDALSFAGSVEIDMLAASVFNAATTGNVTAITFANRPPDGYWRAVTIVETVGGSGGYSVAHPTNTRWAGGAAPTRSTDAGDVNVWTYWAHGESGLILGFPGGMGMAVPA